MEVFVISKEQVAEIDERVRELLSRELGCSDLFGRQSDRDFFYHAVRKMLAFSFEIPQFIPQNDLQFWFSQTDTIMQGAHMPWEVIQAYNCIYHKKSIVITDDSLVSRIVIKVATFIYDVTGITLFNDAEFIDIEICLIEGLELIGVTLKGYNYGSWNRHCLNQAVS
jgi:hypothetical protein